MRCQFDGYQVTEAEYIDNSTLSCVAPMPLRSDPTRGWRCASRTTATSGRARSTTYRTYRRRGAVRRRDGLVRRPHGRGVVAANSRCIFVVDPPAEDGGGASGGVQLVFDRLAVLQDDLVRVYRRNSTTGDDSLLMDVGVYLSEFAPLSSALRLRSGTRTSKATTSRGCRCASSSPRGARRWRSGWGSPSRTSPSPRGRAGRAATDLLLPGADDACPTEEDDERARASSRAARERVSSSTWRRR